MKTDLHWSYVGFKDHHGIAVPLASLRTMKSCGIGEFFDLLPLIDWVSSVGFDTIELLPVLDSGEDPSPYNPLSSCALNPVHLSLAALPNAADLGLFQELSKLNRTSYLDVRRRKMDWLYNYFLKNPDPPDSNFVQKHPWLPFYAKHLQGLYGYPEEFTFFLQAHCYDQLSSVKKRATKKGVFLKGDFPVLVSPASAEVKEYPALFYPHLRAGAPPDYYNPLGQMWGFPPMNFEELRRSDFAYWRRRLKAAEPLFHLYRIDHVVGLFRIWVIPEDKLPHEGYFLPPDPARWEEQGKAILDALLDASPLLPMAEDLGTIPDLVYSTLREYGICGTKVVRWERRWKGDKSFIPFDEYERLSLTCVSTADAPPLRQWWKEYPDEAKAMADFKRWTYHPDLGEDEHLALLTDSHRTTSLFHVNPLQEYLTLFPELSWPNIADERINIPGTLIATNWTYRFRPTIEEMIAHEPLARVMRSLSRIFIPL